MTVNLSGTGKGYLSITEGRCKFEIYGFVRERGKNNAVIQDGTVQTMP